MTFVSCNVYETAVRSPTGDRCLHNITSYFAKHRNRYITSRDVRRLCIRVPRAHIKTRCPNGENRKKFCYANKTLSVGTVYIKTHLKKTPRFRRSRESPRATFSFVRSGQPLRTCKTADYIVYQTIFLGTANSPPKIYRDPTWVSRVRD